MKKLFLAIVLLLSVGNTFGQLKSPGSGITQNGWTWTFQSLNLSNTYPSASNDTLNGSGVTKYFTIGTRNATTFVASGAAAVAGPGVIHYNISTKVASVSSTVNPVVSITPERSTNNSTWVTVPGASTYTVSPSSRTTASTVGIDLTSNPGLYSRLKVTSTDTASVQIYGQVDFTY